MEPTRREELAWAAGLYDGEGSTVQLRKGGNISVRMALTQKHTEVLYKLQRILGVGRVYAVDDERVGYISRWQTTNHEDTVKAAELIWPWLGSVKRAQFTRRMNQSTWHNGSKDKLLCKDETHKVVSRSGGSGRRCATCSQNYHREYMRKRRAYA